MNSLSTLRHILSSLILSTFITCAAEQPSETMDSSISFGTTVEKSFPQQNQQQENPYQCWFCQTLGPKLGNNGSQIRKTEATEMSIYDVMFLFALYWMAKD